MQLWMGILSRLLRRSLLVLEIRESERNQLFFVWWWALDPYFCCSLAKICATSKGKVKALCWPWKADCLLWPPTTQPSSSREVSLLLPFAKAMSAPFHSRIAENASPTLSSLGCCFWQRPDHFQTFLQHKDLCKIQMIYSDRLLSLSIYVWAA